MTFLQMVFVFGALLALLLFLFQVLLAAGLPFGHMAWGGEHKTLPKKLRISSFISALLLIYASAVLLEKGDILNVIRNNTVITISLWIFVAILVPATLVSLKAVQPEAPILVHLED